MLGLTLSRPRMSLLPSTIYKSVPHLCFNSCSDTPATAAMLHLSSQDNLRTQTARAFDAAEMHKILGLLPK